MSGLLFDLPACGETAGTLNAHRRELMRALQDGLALRQTENHPAVDWDAVQDAMRELAEDGDTTGTREEILAAVDMDCFGAGAIYDQLKDAINCIGWAYWRLHRAERRAYQMEVAG